LSEKTIVEAKEGRGLYTKSPPFFALTMGILSNRLLNMTEKAAYCRWNAAKGEKIYLSDFPLNPLIRLCNTSGEMLII